MAPPPLTVIINKGKTADEKAAMVEKVQQAFHQENIEAHIVSIATNDNFARVCEEWVQKARETGTTIVAAGGDGTVNHIAGLCYRHKVTFGVIPLGTFDYFAREHDIPVDIAEAIKIIASAHTRKVSVGVVQDRIFLNNVSFGLYTKLIRHREQASSRFGRIRIIAAFSAAYSLFTKQKSFSIKMSADNNAGNHETIMVFIGNNTLQLENLGMEAAKCTSQNKLAVIIMKRVTRLQIAKLLLLGMVWNLKDESNLIEICADSFEVTNHRKSITLVIDGEILTCATPLRFRIEKEALTVLAPPHPA